MSLAVGVVQLSIADVLELKDEMVEFGRSFPLMLDDRRSILRRVSQAVMIKVMHKR